MIETLLTHGSLPAIAVALLLAGLGLPIPEDPLLLAAGVASHVRGVPLGWVILGCALTVLASDFVLFSIARHFGPSVLERALFRRVLSPARRASLETMIAKRGDAVVFTARHLPGLRAPIFVLAGMHRMRRSRFVLFDALGLCITAPLVVSLGWLGSAHVDLVERQLAKAEHWVGAVVAIAGLLAWWIVSLRRRRTLDDSKR